VDEKAFSQTEKPKINIVFNIYNKTAATAVKSATIRKKHIKIIQLYLQCVQVK